MLEPARIRQPKGDEVLVRIVATGMCHTDMIVRDQYFPVPLPALLGHEGAGVVESVGSLVQGLVKGDHVVLTFELAQPLPLPERVSDGPIQFADPRCSTHFRRQDRDHHLLHSPQR